MHRPAQCVRLKRLDPTCEAFRALLHESRREGYWMLVRLAEGWEDGRNRFSRREETVLAAWHDDRLTAVCGLNVDPYVDSPCEGRVRHLYVLPACRRSGVGRLLVGAIIENARKYFSVLNVRAPTEAFVFYETLGFRRIEAEHATHRLPLRPVVDSRRSA